MAGRASAPNAPSRELRISGRRRDAGLRDAGAEGRRARLGGPRRWSAPGAASSTISWSSISLRAQWMAPIPMSSRARPSVRPRKRFEAPHPEEHVGLVADVEDEVGDAEQHRHDACESPKNVGDLPLGALLARAGRRRSGVAGAPADPGPGPARPSGSAACSRHERCSRAQGRSRLWLFLLGGAGGVRGDPDGEADQRADAGEPAEEALGHRAERAELRRRRSPAGPAACLM